MPSDNEKQTPELPPAAREAREFSRSYATAIELPFVLVGTILVGGAIGYFLDRWLHTKPILMLLFGGIGFAAGVRDVIRRLK
jgi:ATP synthase protein I